MCFRPNEDVKNLKRQVRFSSNVGTKAGACGIGRLPKTYPQLLLLRGTIIWVLLREMGLLLWFRASECLGFSTLWLLRGFVLYLCNCRGNCKLVLIQVEHFPQYTLHADVRLQSLVQILFLACKIRHWNFTCSKTSDAPLTLGEFGSFNPKRCR